MKIDDKIPKRYGIFLIVIFSICMTLLNLLLQTGSFRADLVRYSGTPILFLVNFLPVILLTFLIYFILGRTDWAIGLTYIFFGIFSIVNRTKILYRNEPLMPSDLTLGIESVVISMRSKYKPEFKWVALVVFIFLGILIFFHFFKYKKLKNKTFRIIGLVVVLVISTVLYNKIYKSPKLYQDLPMKENGFFYNDLDNYESKGTVYTFLYNIQYTKLEKPDNYVAKEFANIKPKENYDIKKAPNVIVIMGEAFSDISNLPFFNFSPNENPIEKFNKLEKESVVSGHIVTPTFGGGTADTEFDVLTSSLTANCAPNGTYSFNSVRKNRESIVRIFNNLGYDTVGFHPGYKWFYKRQSVYPKLGFQKSMFLEDVKNPVNKGDYLSEKQTYDLFIDMLDKQLSSSDKPIFDYMVTIQNHGPYSKPKYNHIIDYKTQKPIPQKLYECLGCYFEGVRDMSDGLDRLCKHLEKSEEPFILVYYGDHLPGLDGGMDSYSLLDYNITDNTFESDLRHYSTPFIIWANDKGKEYIDFEKVKELGNNNWISANYLGAYLLEILNYSKYDSFTEYVNGLRKDLPIISRHFLYDGKNSYELKNYNGDLKDEYDKYIRWQYHNVLTPYKNK